MTGLEKHLRGLRDSGRKSLAVYLTGGHPSMDAFVDYVRAAVAGGADVVEVGIPWSDPVIDGPVIQQASQAALESGTTPGAVLDAAAKADVPVPLVPMTYYNPVLRMGLERFAGALVERGMAGAIIPDLPLEELDPWEAAAVGAGVAMVLLAPPSAPEDRLAEICRRSTGFVYGMSLMGVTGVRAGLAETAAAVGSRLRALTDKPILIGIGISDGSQAVAAARHCDGVIVGSAVMRRVVDGVPPAGIEEFVASLRSALDQAPTSSLQP